MSSSKKPVSLFLTSMTPAVWTQFVGFYAERFPGPQGERPEFTPHGAWVIDDQFIDISCGGEAVKAPRLLAGCCYYPTRGPFLVCEYVSTRPGLSPRLAHAACVRIAWAIRMYGAMTGLRQLTFPKHKGVRRMLEKAGFNPVKPEVSMLWAPSWLGVGFAGGEAVPAEVKHAAE